MLGDSEYSNTPFLFVPYTDPVEGYKIRFNRAHETTRCTIERSFGILKKGFHLLHSEIRMSPTKVSWVIVACCVLHNLAIDLNMPLDDDLLSTSTSMLMMLMMMQMKKTCRDYTQDRLEILQIKTRNCDDWDILKETEWQDRYFLVKCFYCHESMKHIVIIILKL